MAVHGALAIYERGMRTAARQPKGSAAAAAMCRRPRAHGHHHLPAAELCPRATFSHDLHGDKNHRDHYVIMMRALP